MGLEFINSNVGSVLFGFALVFSVLVAVRTRLKIDVSSKLVALGFLFSMILRLPFTGGISGIDYLDGISFLIVWGSMYYFVFEMKRLEDVLRIDDNESHLQK